MARALGRYELLRPLARGGMAEVYLARRRVGGIEKLLVVKRMRPERAGDARFLDLFVREARLSMSLAHQNIVPVFDFGRSGDDVFLVMERVEGKDLGSSLQRATRPLPPLVAAFVAAECCQALHYAHHRRGDGGVSLEIVHRDVTPRNVLLSWSGEVKLTDFGIASVAGDSIARLLGTPGYMAPEQARSEPLDARADVYAIGLVLREAVTGKKARGGVDRGTLIAAARDGTLEPWPEGVAPALRAIVDRATALERRERYPDAQAMLADLDTFIVGDRAATRGEPPARQLATWLAETWVGARDDDPSDASLPSGELLSFIDDPEAVGAGTDRSLLATQADDAPLPSPLPIIVPAHRSRAWLGGGALVVAGGFAIWQLATRDPMPPARVVDPARVIAASPLDAGPAVAASPPDAPDPIPVSADAPMAPAPRLDAGLARAEPRPIRVVPAPIDAETAPEVRRRVTINARPWANFTIDRDPTTHQTIETVELRPGTHTIHFSNSHLGVERDVVIEVPTDRDTTHITDLQ